MSERLCPKGGVPISYGTDECEVTSLCAACRCTARNCMCYLAKTSGDER